MGERLLRARARWIEWRFARRMRYHADQLHHTVESEVMGRGAVLFTAACLAPSAVVQFSSGDASHVVIQYGGMWLSMLWAVTLSLGIVAVWVARFVTAAVPAVVIEIVGMVWMGAASIAFAASLVGTDKTAGGTFALGLAIASAGNTIGGRVRLLVRQQIVARRLAKGQT